jgi:hypothetical protein
VTVFYKFSLINQFMAKQLASPKVKPDTKLQPIKTFMRKPSDVLVERFMRDFYPKKPDESHPKKALSKTEDYQKAKGDLEFQFGNQVEIGMKKSKAVATLLVTSDLPICSDVAEIVRNAGFEMAFHPDEEFLVRINEASEESSGLFEKVKANLYVITESQNTSSPHDIVRTAKALLQLGKAIDAVLADEALQHDLQEINNARVRKLAGI